ncbi:MAG: peptidoglycan DD-metalloendopeptidase family protein [Brevinematales bacterium]|jgi:murein DD-endopeptidase MepM/ murein hydrolase activator NlpD
MSFRLLTLCILLFVFSGCFCLEYRVKKGDTLWSISKKFNVPCDAVVAANSGRPGKIIPGQLLKIPENSKKPDKIRTEPDIQDAPGPFLLPADIGEVRHVRSMGRGLIVFLNKDTRIKSIQKGLVKFSGRMNGYNNVIIISYGRDIFAIYGFLRERNVREGETVAGEQVIGSAGNVDMTGNSGLYLEIRNGRKNLNVMGLYPALSGKEVAFAQGNLTKGL